jgi:predicted amidohydrolase YtcJ
MKRAFSVWVVSSWLGAAIGCAPSSSLPPGSRCVDQGPVHADVVLKNGNVYTNRDGSPRAEAIAIKDGRIVKVGTNIEIVPYEQVAKRVIDLKGRTVVPGLVDAHVHLSGIGQREAMLNLEGIASLEEFLATVRTEVGKKKSGEWVKGRGWIETFWKPPVFPTRADLDKVAPDNPVLLTRADGHASVVNSAALRLAGIDKSTPNPFGGEISKDPSGEVNGMLIDHAQELMSKHIPRETLADLERYLVLGVEREQSLGWTEVQIAGNTFTEVEALRKLYQEGRIKIRIYDAVQGPGEDAARLLQQGPSVGEFGGRFTVRAIKIHYDGALGSRGAALLEPYADAGETSGFLTQKDEVLAPLFADALRRGIQVETHAIGDRANRSILDLYERALKAVPAAERKIAEPRFRVEHAQIVDPADVTRFTKLGVIPSMQPSHAIGDLHFAGRRLGQARLDHAYSWRRFLASGSIIAAGSDAPVERGEPLIEFYAAVARKDLKGFQGEGWHPEQAMTRAEALKALTLWPAMAAFEEKERGLIEAGKIADLTVLSADIMLVPVEEIPKAKCMATIVGGEVVYQARDF